MSKLENKINLIKEEIQKSEIWSEKDVLLTEMKKIGIEKLPYSYSALKNFIDSKTMDIHYNNHYKGYVKKLNDALSKKEYGDLELEQIVKSIKRFNKNIRNNAGGAFNHALFWKMLSPKKQDPTKQVLYKIEKDFGSYQEFKNKFNEIAKNRFGSGWVWLVINKKGNLRILSTPNQDNPLMNIYKRRGYPILGLDLWEHSYYLKYQNKRDEYIKNFWDCVNWEFVDELYSSKTKKEKIVNENHKFIYENNEQLKEIFNKLIRTVISEEIKINPEIFSVIVDGVNQFLIDSNKTPINFISKTPIQQVNEVKKIVTILYLNKNNIISENSMTFIKMLNL